MPISKYSSEHGAEYSGVKRWKLVTAACALAAGLALADVTSGNIVGVQEVEAAGGVYTPMSIMFTGVGQNTIAITNLQFSGIARGDSIQIFGNDGDVDTEIFYARRGWEDESIVFQPGDSFWLRPAGAVTTTVAGEVKRQPLVINASAGVYTPMGNGTAAPVAITNITFSGIQRGDSIQIFGNDGDVETEIFYGRRAWEDESIVFQPGDAFWLRPAGAVTVTLPAPTIAE